MNPEAITNIPKIKNHINESTIVSNIPPTNIDLGNEEVNEEIIEAMITYNKHINNTRGGGGVKQTWVHANKAVCGKTLMNSQKLNGESTRNIQPSPQQRQSHLSTTHHISNDARLHSEYPSKVYYSHIIPKPIPRYHPKCYDWRDVPICNVGLSTGNGITQSILNQWTSQRF